MVGNDVVVEGVVVVGVVVVVVVVVVVGSGLAIHRCSCSMADEGHSHFFSLLEDFGFGADCRQ